MSLAPDRDLSPATVEAIRDLFPESAPAEIDDRDLMRVALGIADEDARRAAARAMLGSPSARARFARIVARVSRDVGGARPEGEDLLDVGRLRAFAGPFDARDAAAVFPERFGNPDALARLGNRGWLLEASGRYAVPPGTAEGAPPPGADTGWRDRFVAHFLAEAASIDRLIAEGRWIAGSAILAAGRPNLRKAWRLAADAGDHASAEAFVRALAAPLMEAADWEAFADLAEVGHRTARATGSRLERLLLSYEGVAASRRGDAAGAARLWTRRLELAREAGNPAVEADTLLDLAGLALEGGDPVAWQRWLGEAEGALARADRPDLTAAYWALRARERRRAGDLGAAADHAELALRTLTGTDGFGVGLLVQATAAHTLALCGRLSEGVAAIARVVERCAEEGRALMAADALGQLGAALMETGGDALALRCLEACRAIHAHLGTRRLDRTGGRLDVAGERLRELRERRGSDPAGGFAPEDWPREAVEIVREILESRPARA